MYTDEDLDSAVAAGIVSADVAAALRAYWERQRRVPSADEENVRLVNSFNDVFVVIASALLLFAVAYIGAQAARPLGGIAVAATAWALAEYFTRKRAMALPSIVLLLAFVGGLFATVFFAWPSMSGKSLPGVVASAAAVAAVGAWLHWRRFRVPITIAAAIGAAVVVVIASITALWPPSAEMIEPLILVAGLVVFATAMRWDMTDPERRTRRSDVAFWLHLLAAPLIVKPVFAMLDVAHGGIPSAVVVMALYVVLALVAVVIDRRALMVSALAYVLYAFGTLLSRSFSGDVGFAATALVIGSMLLLLSAFWTAARSALMRGLPSPMRLRLPALR